MLGGQPQTNVGHPFIIDVKPALIQRAANVRPGFRDAGFHERLVHGDPRFQFRPSVLDRRNVTENRLQLRVFQVVDLGAEENLRRFLSGVKPRLTVHDLRDFLRGAALAETFFRRGGVMIWDERDERHGLLEVMNQKLKTLPIKRDGEVQKTPIPDERIGEVQTYEFDRAVPAWYQKLRGKPKPVTIYMRLILPEGADAGVAPAAEAD